MSQKFLRLVASATKVKMPPYNPPVNNAYTEVPIPPYVNHFKLMKFLYYITEKSKCQYMWVDRLRSVVEIWGSEETLGRAILMTRRKIAALAVKKVYVPDEFLDLSEKTRMNTKVHAWKDGGHINYRIRGDAAEFINLLMTKYPVNPYLTRVKEVSAHETILSRLATV